jgi:hypothetical protein
MAGKVLPVDESKMQENSIISGKNIVGIVRTVAGIVGKGAKNVAEDYKAQGVGAKMASNETRAPKAANAPTGPTKNQEWEARHSIRQQQEKVSEKQLKEHYKSMYDQWNH